MPELPEVEAIRSRLARRILNRKIRAVEVRRASTVKPQSPAHLARLATGRTIRGVRRRGKNLILDLSGGYALRIHLRMTGGVKVYGKQDELPPSARVVFELAGSNRLVFEDPRALGILHIYKGDELEGLLSELGPEPLSREFTMELLAESAARSRLPAKLFLMNQRNVAGLGNIYAAEALFRAEIDPRKPMNQVPPERVQVLWGAILTVIRTAVKSAKMTYTRPRNYREADAFLRAVYGREGEPCYRCKTKIRRIQQGGRSTYFCPNCQK